MENEITKKESKIKGFISGIGKKISASVHNVKENLESKKAERVLEERLQKQFEAKASCQTLSCVLSGEKSRIIKVILDVNYNDSSFTLYGENIKIDKNCYFVDKSKQVFRIKMIQHNQETTISLDGNEYKRSVTIFIFEVEDNTNKADEIKSIVNHTNITIIDSTVNKSDLG